MSATTTPERDEAREIKERALKLPPDVRECLALELLHSLDPPQDPEEVKKAWRAELQKRFDEIKNGAVQTYSIEETMAYLRQSLAERRAR